MDLKLDGRCISKVNWIHKEDDILYWKYVLLIRDFVSMFCIVVWIHKFK